MQRVKYFKNEKGEFLGTLLRVFDDDLQVHIRPCFGLTIFSSMQWPANFGQGLEGLGGPYLYQIEGSFEKKGLMMLEDRKGNLHLRIPPKQLENGRAWTGVGGDLMNEAPDVSSLG